MSAPPTPPAGTPSSAPSPGSAAASPPLRIDTEESWNRANAWLGSKDSATSPVASDVKRLLNLAFSRWEQPGAAAPLVVEACRLAGLDPVPGDEIVARPAPTPPTPIPLGHPAPTAQPVPGTQPARTTIPPTRPAPNVGIIAGVAAGIAAVGCIIAGVGAVAGIGAVGAASAGVAVGIIAGVAVRAAMRGGAVAGIIVGIVGVVGVAAGIIAGVAGVAVGIVVGVGVGLIAGVGVFVGVDSAARAIIAEETQRPKR
mgnify:CR=1 FL=1